MALDTQILELPMVGGLAEDTWSKVVAPGSWLRLDNVQIDKAGQFRKRSGYDFLGYPTSLDTYDPIPVRFEAVNFPDVEAISFFAPYGVASFGDTLYASLFLGTDDPRAPFVASWSPALDTWEAKDTLPPFFISREVEVRSTREITAGACVEIDGILWTAFQVDDPYAPKVYLRGTDLDSGAVVQEPTYWFTLLSREAPWSMTKGSGLCVAVYVFETIGGVVVSEYVQATYDPGTRAITRDEVLLIAPSTSSHQLLSACEDPTDASRYVTALHTSASEDIRLSYRNPVTAGSETSGTTHTTGYRVGDLAVCPGPATGTDDGFYISYTVLGVGDAVLGNTRIVRYRALPFVTQWGWILLDSLKAWTQIDNVYAAKGGSGQCFTSGVRQPDGGEGERIVYRPADGNSGTLGQDIYQACGYARIAARAFAWRGKAYLPVVLRETIDGTTDTTSGALIHLTETNGIGGWVATLVGSWSVGEFGGFSLRGDPNLNTPVLLSGAGRDGGDMFVFPTPSKPGVKQTRLDRVTVEAPSQSLLAAPTVAQGLAVLPGGLTSFFDGERVIEAGFLQRPVSTDIQEGAFGAGPEAGDYLWIAHWEHADAKGNMHYSPTSPVAAFSVISSASSMLLSWTMDRATRRAGLSDLRDIGARLVVYRTTTNSAGPFYRLTTPTATNQNFGTTSERPLENDSSDDEIVFEDTFTDADMVALGYGFYPFDLAGAIPNAVLESGPVPPTTHVLNHKQRLFAISGDNTRQLLYSRLFVSGEAPAFPSRFRIFLSDTEEGATALAALDSSLLIFTPSRIYYVQGDGPNDNGSGPSFTEPILFSNALGCTDSRSVITTPGGVFFLAGTGGIHLVDQALNVSRISGPVEDTLAACTIKGVHLDTTRGWVVFACYTTSDQLFPQIAENDGGVFLVYSYWTGVWTRWYLAGTLPSATTLWRGKHVWSRIHNEESGFIAVESTQEQDRHRNASVGVPTYTPIWQVVQTPWLHIGALNGFQRVRRVLVLGRSDSGTIGNEDELRIEAHHDEDEEDTISQLAEHVLSESLGLPVVRAGMHVARQKCSSIRITVTNKDALNSRGTSLHAISLEVGVKKGTAKLSRQNKSPGNGDEGASLWAKQAIRQRAQDSTGSRAQGSALRSAARGAR